MIPHEAITCIFPSTSGATAPSALPLYVCEMQLWLFQWKNVLKASFCSRKWGRKPLPKEGGKLNIYLVIQKYISEFRFTFLIVFAGF